jgi:hypothetical protein
MRYDFPNVLAELTGAIEIIEHRIGQYTTVRKTDLHTFPQASGLRLRVITDLGVLHFLLPKYGNVSLAMFEDSIAKEILRLVSEHKVETDDPLNSVSDPQESRKA